MPMAERRVLLVVDADASNRGALQTLLAATPHCLVMATDPEDGALRFSEAKPDLIFLADSACGPHGGALLEKLAARADAAAALIFATGAAGRLPPVRDAMLPAALSAVLPHPLTRAALDHALTELSARRAAVFAGSAMELDMDSLLPRLAEVHEGNGHALGNTRPEPPPPLAETDSPPVLASEATGPGDELPAAEEARPNGPPVDEPTMLSGPDDAQAVADAIADMPEPGAPAQEAPATEQTADTVEASTAELAEAARQADEEAERTPPEGTPSAIVQEALAEPAAATDPPSEPTAEVTPQLAVDPPTGEVAVKTNVGDEPAGLEEIRAAVGEATPATPGADEDVFASAPAAAPAATPEEPPPPSEPIVIPHEPAAPRTDQRHAAAPVSERAPQTAGAPMPRVVKLDAPAIPKDVELSSSERAQTGKGGFRTVDESILGPDLSYRLVLLYRLLDGGTLYQILGVERDADAAALSKAFHRISLEFHPDRAVLMSAGPLKDCMRAVYGRATEAFRVLSDETQRRAYEAALAEQRQGPAFDPAATQRTVQTTPQLPSVIVEDVGGDQSVRPALQSSANTRLAPPPAPPLRGQARTKASTSPQFPVPPSTPPPAPAPVAAPALEPLLEDAATTVGGRKFLRLAAQALGRNDLNGARLNLTFALGYEPDNGVLKKRLAEIESKMQRPSAR